MEPELEKFVCFGIDRCQQPVALIFQPNYSLVHRDVNRQFAVPGL
jgi:hypothetical protein